MKAKQYIKDFTNGLRFSTEAEVKEAISKLITAFITDFEDVMKARNIGNGSKEVSLSRLIQEHNDKWSRVVFGINKFLENGNYNAILTYSGFYEILKLINPTYTHIIEKYNL